MTSRISHNNLFDPVMYLIDKQVKRHFNAANGGPSGEGGGGGTVVAPKQYVEPIGLYRDSRGRLSRVEGWENVNYELTYLDNGQLGSVDVTQRITGKHLRFTLEYDNNRLLTGVVPELINEGSGESVQIDIPNAIEDY